MNDKYLMLEAVVHEDIRGLIKLVTGKEKDVGKFIGGSAAHLAAMSKLIFKSIKIMTMSKLDKPLTDRLRNELNSRIPFEVRVFNDSSPSTFLTLPSHLIFISDSMLDELNDREVMAMLLREVGAAKQMHVPLKVASGEVIDTTMNIIRDKIFDMLKKNPRNTALSILAAAATLILQNVLTMYSNNWINKKLEFKKDNYAVRLGYGKELISAIKKIKGQYKKRNIVNSKTQKTIKWLDTQFKANPKSQKRIENILTHEKALQGLARRA